MHNTHISYDDDDGLWNVQKNKPHHKKNTEENEECLNIVNVVWAFGVGLSLGHISLIGITVSLYV